MVEVDLGERKIKTVPKKKDYVVGAIPRGAIGRGVEYGQDWVCPCGVENQGFWMIMSLGQYLVEAVLGAAP